MDELERENRQLRQDLLRERIARETGTIPSVLGDGDEDAMRQSAQDALAWKGTPIPQPPTTSVYPATSSVNGVSQASAEALKYFTPQQINELYAENRLAALGAPAPPPRRNGEHGQHTHGF